MSRRTRDATALAAGSAVSGLLAYVFFAATTRALGAEAAGPVSVLWSYWTFAGAALTFPVQHWIARTATTVGEGVVRAAARRLAGVTGSAAVVLAALAWVVRDPLFGRGDPWFPLMVGLVTLGSALVGVVRGGLAARGRLVALASSLVAENALRCLAVAGLLVAGVRSPAAYGLCLVAGHLVVVLWPSALRYSRDRREREPRTGGGPLAFLAGAGAAQLVAQSVLTGGPVVLALSGGGQGQVTTLFAALALFRAPYMLALGLVSAVTARVAALVVGGQAVRVQRLRRAVVQVAAVAAALAAGGGAWPGPELLRLVFGADVVLGRVQGALTASSCTLAIGNLVLVVLALAHGRAAAAARAWLFALAAATVAYAALPTLSALLRVVACLLVAEVAAFVILGWQRTSSPRGAPRSRTAGRDGAAPAGRGRSDG